MWSYFYLLVPIEPRRDDNLKEAPAEDAGERMREHPMWIRLEDAIVRALEPFMEARLAVSRALDAVQPVNPT
jgi:hypothetical protein